MTVDDWWRQEWDPRLNSNKKKAHNGTSYPATETTANATTAATATPKATTATTATPGAGKKKLDTSNSSSYTVRIWDCPLARTFEVANVPFVTGKRRWWKFSK